jgi:hypothetical protein
MQLTLADIMARIERLERLALGLGREAVLQRGAVDVLLYREKKHYLAGIRDAQVAHLPAGLEVGREPVRTRGRQEGVGDVHRADRVHLASAGRSSRLTPLGARPPRNVSLLRVRSRG